jgi:hypothetical protein
MNRGDFVRKEDRKVEGMGETGRRFPKEDRGGWESGLKPAKKEKGGEWAIR